LLWGKNNQILPARPWGLPGSAGHVAHVLYEADEAVGLVGYRAVCLACRTLDNHYHDGRNEHAAADDEEVLECALAAYVCHRYQKGLAL